METLAKTLLAAAILLAVVGGMLLLFSGLGLTRLPGDIVIRRKNVTVHLPRHGQAAAPLGREPTVLLDDAFELDDAPRWEQFYFVTGNEPFLVAPIVESANRVAMDGRGAPTALRLGRR